MMDEVQGGQPIAAQGQYISCMKINGVPLLPPLMTEESRNEMKYYKQLARAVERRLCDLKMLDDSSPYSTSLHSTNLPSDTEECFDQTNISYDNPLHRSSLSLTQPEPLPPDQTLDSNDFESMNSQVTIIDMSSENKNEKPAITVDDQGSSLVAVAHNIHLQGSEKSLLSQWPSKEYLAKKGGPYKSSYSTKTTTSKDSASFSTITSQTASSNNQLKRKIATPSKKEKTSPFVNKKPSKSASPYEPSKPKQAIKKIFTSQRLSPAKNITGSLNNISSGLSSPPKLVRQNSYTLESPSPLLLAHLEVRSITSGIDVGSISMSESTSVDQTIDLSASTSPETKPQHILANIAKSNQNRASDASNSESKISPLSSKNERNNFKKLIKESESRKFSASSHPHPSSFPSATSPSATSAIKEISHSEENIFQGLIQNEFENKIVSNGIEILSDLKSTKDSPKLYFDFIMRKFQEEHEKQMDALIQKQSEEQVTLKKSFENQQKLLLNQFQTAFSNSYNQAAKNVHVPQSKISTHMNSDNYARRNDHFEKNTKVQSLHKDSYVNSNENSRCESMERYLSISGDVLNTSRCLLVNRKTVNLSPTNIQCVNVVPTGRHERISPLEESNGLPQTSGQVYRELPALDTGRTNDTMDDLNFTFSSDEGVYTDKLYTDGNRNKYFSTASHQKDDCEKASKLKSARIKISEIQKNLASQSLSMTSVVPDREWAEQAPPVASGAVSLSSIHVMGDHCPPNLAHRNHLSLNLTEIHKPSSNLMAIKIKYKTSQEIEREVRASTIIVAHCRGYLTRRLMKTERVEATVQTIRDTLLCALQLHRDEGGIQGADVDLHRRLIQQITAACYSLHEIFILWSPSEQMSTIRQDRERRRHRTNLSPLHRQLSATTQKFIRRRLEGMSRSHSGVFSSRLTPRNSHPHSMTRSHYESGDQLRAAPGDKSRRSLAMAGDLHPRKPWR